MGYRIHYDSIHIGKAKGNKRGSGWWAGVIVLLLVLCAVVVKTVGLEWVQDVLLPGDPAVTAAALDGMVQDLKEGASIVDAVTAFCQEIVQGAQ